MSYETRLIQFKKQVKHIEYQKNTMNSLIYWDKITNMPEKGIEYRAKVMAFMGDQMYNMMTDQRFLNDVKYFYGHRKNSDLTNAMVRRIVESSESVNCIPEEEYSSYVELIAVSEAVWEKARANNDFEMLQPYLEQIFEHFKKFAEYWGYEKNPYDALMSYYVDGLTVELIDGLVEEIKPFLVSALSEISSIDEKSEFKVPVTLKKETQEKLWRELLDTLGFDFSAGRVDTGAHPTILANSPWDVRIVSNYKEDDLYFGFFNIMHSGGKGIYHQSINKELVGTFLAEVPSFALEEAIGRLYEDIIGKSKCFWKYFGKTVEKYAVEDGSYTADSEDIALQCYEYVNKVNGSQIRIEADELTCLLHIIVRYELEKEIINGQLEVKDLPEAWNRKCSKYLGKTPENDASGVLQDIHWAAGYVGYFPTYIYANLISAQLAGAFFKENERMSETAERRDFESIKEWLTKNVFRFGAQYSTKEIVELATGKPVSHNDFIRYLTNKFSDVYHINLKREK